MSRTPPARARYPWHSPSSVATSGGYATTLGHHRSPLLSRSTLSSACGTPLPLTTAAFLIHCPSLLATLHADHRQKRVRLVMHGA